VGVWVRRTAVGGEGAGCGRRVCAHAGPSPPPRPRSRRQPPPKDPGASSCRAGGRDGRGTCPEVYAGPPGTSETIWRREYLGVFSSPICKPMVAAAPPTRYASSAACPMCGCRGFKGQRGVAGRYVRERAVRGGSTIDVARFFEEVLARLSCQRLILLGETPGCNQRTGRTTRSHAAPRCTPPMESAKRGRRDGATIAGV